MLGSIRIACLAWVALVDALGAPPAAAAAATDASTPDPVIEWFAGDVDAAFARARSEHKPLFLYWGATWCPPCNQVKATLFKRRDFVERSRQFVPVYVDGDQPNAQKLADRFRVRGYPTMILFGTDGMEITRLPGEIDPQQYLETLSLGLGRGRSARATLRSALAPQASGLTAEDWKLLASYSWDTDEGQLVPADRVASTLVALAQACPPRYQASSDRLALRAIVATASGRGTVGVGRARSLARVQSVLADAQRARAVFDLLVQWAPEMVGSLTDPGGAERQQLIASWDTRLAAFASDPALSTADRLDALGTRARLQKLADPNVAIAPPLVAAIEAAAQRADRDTSDRYERQAVIPSAAEALAAADLGPQSDALLQAELARSPSPYYLMVVLAVNARHRGDAAAALNWYEKAYGSAQGPATRLQWGTRYVVALTQLAPNQAERVSQAVERVIGDLDPAAETFDGRNRIALSQMGAALQAWNSGHAHDGAIQAAIARLDGVCAKIESVAPERVVCTSLFRPTAATAVAPGG